MVLPRARKSFVCRDLVGILAGDEGILRITNGCWRQNSITVGDGAALDSI